MKYQSITENVTIAYAPEERRTAENSAPFTIPITCIALNKELVFVDCGIFVDVASDFRKEMERKYNKPTSHLLLTHSNWDHIFAIEAFEDVNIVIGNPGIQTIKKQLKDGYLSFEKRQEWADRRYSDNKYMKNLIMNAHIFPPKMEIKNEFTIGKKDAQILFKVIRGHSRDSSFVYNNTDKVLITGDNLLECYPQLPGLPEDTMKTFALWESLEIDYVIPGHGIVVDKEFVKKVRNYFEKLILYLEEAIDNKRKIKHVLEDDKLPSYFAINRFNFELASRPNNNWIEMITKVWYNHLKRKKSKK